MTRDYFKQALYNPYFQTEHYKNETASGKFENKLFYFFRKINLFIKRNKDDKNKKSYSK